MDRFAPALHRVSRELDLPAAERAVILMEMAADLQAIYEREREHGASDDAAAMRAERIVLGSSEMLRRLSQLHAHSWRGWSERTGARLAHGVERWLILLAVVPVMLVATAVAAPLVLSPNSPAAWVLIALGALLVGAVAIEGVHVRRHVGGRPRNLSMIAVLSALATACGALAVTLALYHAAMERSPVADAVGGDQVRLATAVAQHGPALVLGLLLGIAGAFSWFILLHLAAMQRVREVDALLNGSDPTGDLHGDPRVRALVRGRQR